MTVSKAKKRETDELVTRFALARHINNIAQDACEKFQTTEQDWRESFERARKVLELLAVEDDADSCTAATTLLFVASDLLWGYPAAAKLAGDPPADKKQAVA